MWCRRLECRLCARGRARNVGAHGYGAQELWNSTGNPCVASAHRCGEGRSRGVIWHFVRWEWWV